MIGLVMLVCLADNSECRQIAAKGFSTDVETCEQVALALDGVFRENHNAYVAASQCINWGAGT